MKPEYSNQFPITPKPKKTVWTLWYGSQKLYTGTYKLCIAEREKNKKTGNFNKQTFKIC